MPEVSNAVMLKRLVELIEILHKARYQQGQEDVLKSMPPDVEVDDDETE